GGGGGEEGMGRGKEKQSCSTTGPGSSRSSAAIRPPERVTTRYPQRSVGVRPRTATTGLADTVPSSATAPGTTRACPRPLAAAKAALACRYVRMPPDVGPYHWVTSTTLIPPAPTPPRATSCPGPARGAHRRRRSAHRAPGAAPDRA